MSAVTHPKHSKDPHAKKTHAGPLDWRMLVEWLSEDGVISATEAQRCGDANKLKARTGMHFVRQQDGTALEVPN